MTIPVALRPQNYPGSRNTLFFSYNGKDRRVPQSPPTRGARIETFEASFEALNLQVAPYAGGAD